MAENLIYGKSVFDFGAKGDGKSDDTEAFVKAFKSGESLICIPFGNYTVNKEIAVNSGVRINAHPRATVNFKGITAKEKSIGIVINGGNWINTDAENCAFDLSETSGFILENLSVKSYSDCAVGICNSKNTLISKVNISSESSASGIIFGGDVTFTKLCNISFDGCANAVEIASGCDNYALFADGITIKDCETALFAKNCLFRNSYLCGIKGNASVNALHFEGGEVSDVSIRDINVHDGFVYFEGTKLFSLNIDRFERDISLDTSITKPSFVMKDCPECTLIFDGIALDAIILAKKSVPDVKMTAAKMVTVSPASNNYTLELPIARKDNFVIPYGGFEALSIFSQE